MKRVLPYRTTAIIVLSLFAVVFTTLGACSNQGEGDRCEVENGNDDCKTEEGLICYPSEQLNNKSNSDRCCPTDRTKATQAVCQTPVDVVGNDATAPTDTGPPITPDANVPNADAATATDASDAGSDADADAQ